MTVPGYAPASPDPPENCAEVLEDLVAGGN